MTERTRAEVDDVDAALAKGDLKLRLDGYKLKGSWALVRTKGWPGASRRSRDGDEGGEGTGTIGDMHDGSEYS